MNDKMFPGVLNKNELKNIATMQETLEFLTRVMRGEIKEQNIIVLTHKNGKEVVSETDIVDTIANVRDRNQAAKLLMDYYKQSKEIDAMDGICISIDIPRNKRGSNGKKNKAK